MLAVSTTWPLLQHTEKSCSNKLYYLTRIQLIQNYFAIIHVVLYDLHKMDSREIKITDDRLQKLSTTQHSVTSINNNDN